ncbi:FG-GAP repeat domain-containing protein [Agromyces arachidis]|uniref:FG-GAP repeat domain-containing protein n=1 Tax=Agromyces arachidis TaxID=766966 RepID=UPI004056E2FA
MATAVAAVVALVAGVLTASVAGPVPRAAAAADPKDFNAGMIISDQVFYDSSTMTVAQIQSFLNARVPSCASGYVCLKDYSQATTSQPARSEGCAAYAGQSSESAALIIYKVARACGINPRSLIVLIEKEQGLITDATPSSRQYRSATGYGCPDTADCDTTYYGFFNQVYNAAWQFRKYRANPGIRAYQAGRYNTILWHPNTACGSSQVYIQNQATAGLYIYTPYRPNAAALANLYGTGDACSSYGNRNFWRMFTDWFGSTSTPAAPAPTAVPTSTIPLVYATDAAGALYLYPGTGTGAWRTRLQVGSGWNSMEFVEGAGDVTGDGFRDVLAIDGAGALWIYPTDGVGTFRTRIAAGTGFEDVTALFAAGDFDSDGDQDFFTRDADGVLMLHRNNGAGQFAPKRVGSGWNVFNLIVGAIDFNGDGRIDVLGRDASGGLWLYPGNGRAGWGTGVRVGNGWNVMSRILTPGDFDGDGAADVLARDAAGALWLYPGNGSGGWRAPKVVGSGWNTMNVIGGPGPKSGSAVPLTTGMGDLTGDGTRDILAQDDGVGTWIYPSNGSGGWLPRREAPGEWSGIDALISGGDFDGDGHRDVLGRDAAGDLWRYPNDGAGGFAARVKAGNGWSDFTIFGAGDADGDRDWDLIARDTGGTLWLYPGDGAGGFEPRRSLGSGWQSMLWVFSPGDFDGDGRSDIIAITAAGDMRLYRGGTTGYASPVTIGNGWQGMTWVGSPGDFDGDLRPDVLARTAEGALRIYPGNGRGGWLSVRQIGNGWGVMELIG